MTSLGVSRFRWSRAYGLRIVGAVVVVLAVLWMAAALTGFAAWSLVLLVLGALAALACLARFLVLPPVLLEVSSEGYRMRHVRGGGVAEARWADVEAVEGGGTAEGSVMTITLTGGRVTTVPLGLLGEHGASAERQVHDRLNAAFGYRRLGGR